ncbi:MAG: Rrf2 family transcriptional regulator [Ruminococcus sp.]|nr:Rrf2 family transcriptional regulator [Ruminococcus sp.]
MFISTKGKYAIKLMLDLAIYNNGDPVRLKDIAKRQDISIKYLEQIVNILSKRGYLKSARGPQGGYRLAGNPADYTIGDILRTTEGNMAPVACLEDEINQCERSYKCDTLWIWEDLYKLINNYIDSITLADIIDKKNNRRFNDDTQTN